MTRNQAFRTPHREPFADRDDLNLQARHVTGPLSFCNPTHARFATKSIRVTDSQSNSQGHDSSKSNPPQNIQFQWRARDNRKGRHPLIVPPNHAALNLPPPTNKPRAILHNVARMFTAFPVWDVSYLVALFFTVGCLIFIACGLFYWLPIAYPSTEFPHEALTAGGVTSFVGGTLFEIGAVFLMLEATNENQTGCFGWAIEEVFEEHHHANGNEEKGGGGYRLRPSSSHCKHSHSNRKSCTSAKDQNGSQPERTKRAFRWWPTRHELRHHYLHEIGFWASLIEFIGATIFWGMPTSIPSLFSPASEQRLTCLF